MSWHDPDREDTTIYKVVVNHEEQYSIWPEYKGHPLGWKDVGKVGPKPECLAYIREVWTDMRPLNLRKKMEEMAKNPPPPPPTCVLPPTSVSFGHDLISIRRRFLIRTDPAKRTWSIGFVRAIIRLKSGYALREQLHCLKKPSIVIMRILSSRTRGEGLN